MNLIDYELASQQEKANSMDSFKILSGIKMFGGKARIGKYIVNHIMNMAVRMKQDGHKADIFIDMFGGGGKISLSIPEGFFHTIVLNDLNYGIYNFFNCCKEKPEALVRMIEELGNVMSREFFYLCAYCRSNNGYTMKKQEADNIIREASELRKTIEDVEDLLKNAKELRREKGLTDEEIEIIGKNNQTEEEKELVNSIELEEEDKALLTIADKIERAERIKKVYDLMADIRIQPLLSAAMTYWVTQASFNGATDPDKATYRFGLKDNKSGVPTRSNEMEDIQKSIDHARRHIKVVHEKMHRLNIVVENLDYRELIKKYNGLPYKTASNEAKQVEGYKKLNKLWYGDSPYHPATLNGAEAAPYEDTFNISMAREMIHILHGDKKDEYGEIPYFIKSDYSPEYTCGQFKQQLKEAEEKLKEEEKKGKDKKKISSYKSYISRMKRQVMFSEKCRHDFDILEENKEHGERKANTKNPEFYVIDLGEFDKGAVNSDDGSMMKGREFIWCRGNYII